MRCLGYLQGKGVQGMKPLTIFGVMLIAIGITGLAIDNI